MDCTKKMRKYSKWNCVRLIILLLFFGVTSHKAVAQKTNCNIIGRVIDEKQNPIPYASVAIYNGTLPITGVITNNDGKFSLKTDLSATEYRLAVDFVGYEEYEKIITLDRACIDMGVIILKEDAVVLKEVVVSAKETVRKSTVEHTSINVAADITASKGTAVDVLRSASSVTVLNDEIAIRGNKNILVLIDGVPTTANDLSVIPAANIQSIELITNPDASHDAEGTGGIINIISKRSRAEGFRGMVAANYGFNHFANANIAFTYNRPKTAWRFNYNVKYEDDVVNSTLNRKVYGTGYEVSQQMRATRYTFNNNITLGADFRINTRNRLSIDAKVMIPRLNINQDLHNTFSEYEEKRYNDVTWNRLNIEGSIAYTYIIKPEVSDIIIRTSVSKIWGERPSHYWLEGVENNRSVSGGSPFIPAIQTDYKHKFPLGVLSAGVKLTYRQNDVYHKFYECVDGEWAYSNTMSNDLLHTELVPATYVMFSSHIGKKITYKVGLRGEFSTIKLNSTHDDIDERNNSFFLAPTLSGIYKLKENQDFSLALSRRIGRPTYPQLIPYMSMVDAATYEQGNMHLNPEKATKVDVSYNLRTEMVNLFVNAYLNYTTDYIAQVTKMDNERLITTYANAESDFKTGVELSMRVTPARWLNFSLSTNTYYVTTKGMFEGANIDNSGWTNNSNLMFDFIPWKGSDIQLQYFITTPQHYPQLTTSFTHQMNIGVKQSFLKGTMTTSLLITDVLNTASWEVWSHNNLFELRNSSRNKSRMLWLGISYNFNSFRQKIKQNTETDRALIKLGL